MMLKSVERLLEFVGDMNAIDGEWLDGWNRAVLATVEKIEKEVAERYVELPKDADGEYIHIGDVMDSRVDYLFDGKPFTVRALVLCEDGWEVADGRFGNRYEPDSLRHHHAPTVEDVLQKLLEQAVGYSDAHTTVALDAIAEYAEKLRLAGDAE